MTKPEAELYLQLAAIAHNEGLLTEKQCALAQYLADEYFPAFRIPEELYHFDS